MRKTFIAVALCGLALVGPAPAVQASAIETACVRSDRAAGNRGLCRCIQQMADRHLTRSDQRQAARFFRDPDRAQQIRVSRDSRDRAFWERYRAFADAAEATCVR
jgi:hypothetical protein